VVALYEGQLEILKQKNFGEKKNQDQIFNLAQRESVIKALKKENGQLKAKVNRLKVKR